MIVKIIDDLPHSIKREIVRIVGEDPPLIHVVDFQNKISGRSHPPRKSALTVCPHSLQRNASRGIIGDNISNIDKIPVSVSALVETKTPVGNSSRITSLHDRVAKMSDLRQSRS